MLEQLIAEYTKLPCNYCGGNLHIILIDDNVNDDSIEWCYKECYYRKDFLGMLICSLLLAEEECDRLKIIIDGYNLGETKIDSYSYLIDNFYS